MRIITGYCELHMKHTLHFSGKIHKLLIVKPPLHVITIVI